MKKTLLVAVMSVIMIAMAACGGGGNHSKAFNQSKKILDNITSSINKAKTCDDLDMAAFGILGMLGVEGIDAMSEAETQELSELTDKMNELMEKKRAELNWKEYDFWSSDDIDDDSFFEDEEE